MAFFRFLARRSQGDPTVVAMVPLMAPAAVACMTVGVTTETPLRAQSSRKMVLLPLFGVKLITTRSGQ